jgi:hypothetical protein
LAAPKSTSDQDDGGYCDLGQGDSTDAAERNDYADDRPRCRQDCGAVDLERGGEPEKSTGEWNGLSGRESEQKARP